jgi:hypothetical protein
VDSRSQTLAAGTGMHVHTLRIQVTTGPLVRLSLRLTPRKGLKAAKMLPALTMRRLVLVPPRAAG